MGLAAAIQTALKQTKKNTQSDIGIQHEHSNAAEKVESVFLRYYKMMKIHNDKASFYNKISKWVVSK